MGSPVSGGVAPGYFINPLRGFSEYPYPPCPPINVGYAPAEPEVVLSEQRFGSGFGAQLAECYIEPSGETTLCTY